MAAGQRAVQNNSPKGDFMCEIKPEASQRAARVRSAIEQELEAEARSAGRTSDADGSQMFMDGGVPAEMFSDGRVGDEAPEVLTT